MPTLCITGKLEYVGALASSAPMEFFLNVVSARHM